jgi:hypothetical protein
VSEEILRRVRKYSSANKDIPFKTTLFIYSNIFSPEVIKIDQLIFRNAKEIYFNEKFPIV